MDYMTFVVNVVEIPKHCVDSVPADSRSGSCSLDDVEENVRWSTLSMCWWLLRD